MLKRLSLYWWCQIGGWLFQAFLFIFIAYSMDPMRLNRPYYSRVALVTLTGIAVTHLLRTIIVRYKLLQAPNRKLLIFFLLSVFVFSVLFSGISEIFFQLFHVSSQKISFKYELARLMWNIPTIFIWNLIYYMWHYVEKTRQGELDKLKLESTVKELELKTIKSQLNPHFIFNSLNSVRALVDENPQRARTAITELSNILRSSMQAEKVEIVSLENELSIVEDYLALENIRYEERLKVHFDIEQDTLDLPVPPLMLQTLVENAIKHGISKSVSGGVVSIASKINGTRHEITIQNTGQITGTGELNGHGFGLQSTRQRLELLYENKATFQIYNKDEKTVEAKVELPL